MKKKSWNTTTASKKNKRKIKCLETCQKTTYNLIWLCKFSRFWFQNFVCEKSRTSRRAFNTQRKRSKQKIPFCNHQCLDLLLRCFLERFSEILFEDRLSYFKNRSSPEIGFFGLPCQISEVSDKKELHLTPILYDGQTEKFDVSIQKKKLLFILFFNSKKAKQMLFSCGSNFLLFWILIFNNVFSVLQSLMFLRPSTKSFYKFLKLNHQK